MTVKKFKDRWKKRITKSKKKTPFKWTLCKKWKRKITYICFKLLTIRKIILLSWRFVLSFNEYLKLSGVYVHLSTVMFTLAFLSSKQDITDYKFCGLPKHHYIFIKSFHIENMYSLERLNIPNLPLGRAWMENCHTMKSPL